MNRFYVKIALWLVFLAGVISALEYTNELAESRQTSAAHVGESARKIRRPLLAGLFGLGGYGLGGYHLLSIWFVVKFILLYVAAIVAASVWAYTKFFGYHNGGGIGHGGGYGSGYGGGYGSSGGGAITAYESYSPPIAYSSPTFITAPDHHDHHHESIEYSSPSFDGPDPYNAYSSYSSGATIPSDPSFSSSFTPPEYGASGPPAPFYGSPYRRSSDVSASGTSSATASSTYSSTSNSNGGSSKRKQRQKRSSPSKSSRTERQAPEFDVANWLSNINWAEITFQFLGVDTAGCRRRFVCEFDYRASHNPMTRMAYELLGRQIFENYRDPNALPPAHFADCEQMYNECAAANEYNSNAADSSTTTTATVPQADAAEEEESPLTSNNVIEYDDNGNKKIEPLEASARSLQNGDGGVVNVHDIGRIVMLRAEQ